VWNHDGERTVGCDGFVVYSVPWPPSHCVGSTCDCEVVVLQKEGARQPSLEIEPDPVEAPWAARDTNIKPRGEFVHIYSVV
jgi:hypothetical protein